MSSSTSSSVLVAFADRVRVPNQHDRVFNSDCIFSFDTPLAKDGIYICMEKFIGMGRRFVSSYHQRTGNNLFVQLLRERVPKEIDPAEKESEPKVSRLAIGVEGGFRPEEKKYNEVETVNIVLLPEWKVFPLDSADMPLAVSMSAKAIVSADSAVRKEQLEQASGTWDGEKVEVSKYAQDLKQLDNGVKIPPKGWKCSRCDLTCNLWLNLTDGAILCGRRFFDGSGGNNHAVEHYQETKYPLCVKLGTITADGKADVFSYAEDAMVSDPKLKEHLAHFGINIAQLEKTDKSMAEIEIEANEKIGEWATLTESGSKLKPVYGPGYTGLANLGNTCYINSLMQVLMTLPPFIKEYSGDKATTAFNKANLHDPLSDLRLQLCKMGSGLWSEFYSHPPTEDEVKMYGEDYWQAGVRADAFKAVVGKGHAEFSGKNQQDAQEFFLHLCTLLERMQRTPGEENPAESLQFDVEDRVECGASGKVAYKTRREDYLPLPIAMEAATNQAEVKAFEERKKAVEADGGHIKDDERVRPNIPLQACLDLFCQTEEVPDYTSPVTGNKTVAKKTMRLQTFPQYLLIQLKKFDIGSDWVPFKLDVNVDMPDEIDLAQLTAKGLQPGEEEMPAGDGKPAAPAEPAIVPDPNIVEQLSAMGFDVNGCKRAAFHTKNAGVEAAMNWVLENSNTPDFAAPFEAPKSGGSKSSFVPDAEALGNLLSMGMPEAKCVKALKETGNNMERAVDWIFSHPDDDGTMEEDGAPAGAEGSGGKKQLNTGPPKYQLHAFISHMGRSTLVGHYVAHIKRDGKWVIYNDEKVALSEKPPRGLGYLYLYKRVDAE